MHGWAFKDLSPEVENRCKAYLADGDPNHLLNTNYLDARIGVLDRLSNKERRDNGLPIKKIRKPDPAPEPDKLPCGHEAGDKSHLHLGEDAEDAMLVFIVLQDGHTIIQSEMEPEALAAYFEAAAQFVRRASTDRKAEEN